MNDGAAGQKDFEQADAHRPESGQPESGLPGPGRTVEIREVRREDAATLAALQAANRPYVADWDPERPDSFYTAEGQSQRIEGALADRAAGRCWPGVILLDGQLCGQVILGGVVSMYAFSKATLGYWVAKPHWGGGVATEAVGQTLHLAQSVLGLHRVEAHTRLENYGSHRVLQKNGFTQWGIASQHMLIDGEWRDEIFWERILS